MKRLVDLLVGMLFIFSFSSIYGQVPQDSWSMGFGLKYPRFISSGITPLETNYGGYLSIQRDFTEHVGLRISGNYLHLEGKYNGLTQSTNILSANYDLFYNFVPCEAASQFITLGVSNILYKFDKELEAASPSKLRLDIQMNFGLGAQWTLGEDWKLLTEIDYYTPGNGKLDGLSNVGNGLLGGNYDTYMGMQIGFQYYFSKGEPSKYCGTYNGLSAKTESIDYDRIEALIKQNALRQNETVDYARIENIVKNTKSTQAETPKTAQLSNWVLIGVNFASKSTEFKTEAYPILYHTIQILSQNPDLKVEIQGYTDNLGSDEDNLALSLKRADAVKDYLAAHGIASTRLIAKGYGAKNPVADNNTASGRVLNRRIEFRVINN